MTGRREGRAWLPLAGLALLAMLLGFGLQHPSREVVSPFVGKPAPHFVLPQLGAPRQTLSPASLQGQVWVLNVWASWCAPCRDEHPLLVAVVRASGVPLVGINYKDDPRNAQEWLLRLGNPYLVTAVDSDGHTGINYGVNGVPETFVIDKAGVVRHKHVGPLTQQVWANELLPLIHKLQG